MLIRRYPSRYVMLDAWRGLAALAVVAFHTLPLPFDVGSPAVLVFFVISGYCIAASARRGEREHASLGGFMRRRATRILPPYLAAVGWFVATRLVKSASGGPNQLAGGALRWVLNFSLTQWLYLLVHPSVHPSSNPTLFVAAFWSLNYEEQFYLVMGLLMLVGSRYAWGRGLRGVWTLTAVGLIWALFRPSISCGLFIECWVPFGIGALLYYCQCEPERRGAVGAFAATMTLGFVAGGVALARHGFVAAPDRNAWVEIFVACAFAAVLFVLRPIDAAFSTWRFRHLFLFCGTISYSLYLIHQCNIHFVEIAISKVLGPAAPSWLLLGARVPLHVALATGFWWLCERPFLSRRPSRVADGPLARVPPTPPPGPPPVMYAAAAGDA